MNNLAQTPLIDNQDFLLSSTFIDQNDFSLEPQQNLSICNANSFLNIDQPALSASTNQPDIKDEQLDFDVFDLNLLQKDDQELVDWFGQNYMPQISVNSAEKLLNIDLTSIDNVTTSNNVFEITNDHQSVANKLENSPKEIVLPSSLTPQRVSTRLIKKIHR